MDEELMTAKELGQLLIVPPYTAWRIGREDLIPGATVRVGRWIRFRRSVVLEWIARGGSRQIENEPAGAV